MLVNEVPVSGRSNIFVSGSGFIESSKQHVKQLWGAVKQPNIFLPTLFIFLWQATPQSDSAMFFFMYVLNNNNRKTKKNWKSIVQSSAVQLFYLFDYVPAGVCNTGVGLNMML